MGFSWFRSDCDKYTDRCEKKADRRHSGVTDSRGAPEKHHGFKTILSTIPFSKSDLTSASLKSIKERFKTYNVDIYSLLEPEKPDQFIEELRMEIVQEMCSNGSSAKDIAQKTGLSESYIKRVWN